MKFNCCYNSNMKNLTCTDEIHFVVSFEVFHRRSVHGAGSLFVACGEMTLKLAAIHSRAGRCTS